MKISRIYDNKRKNDNNLKSLLIIGTSEYGVTNEIMEIMNEEEIINYYGMNGSIYESFKSIKDEDFEDTNLYILKPYGTHSSATFNLNVNGVSYNDCVVFKSIFSNQIYNDVNILISKIGVTFEFPNELSLKNITYFYNDFNTVYSFIEKINEDTRGGTNVIIANVTCEEFSSFDESFYYINENKHLSGGDSGLNLTNEDKYNALESSYDLIRGMEVDYICLTDICLNSDCNMSNKFYKQLFLLCIEQLQFGILTLGLITYYSDNILDTSLSEEQFELLSKIVKVEPELESLKFLMIVLYDKLYYGHYKKLINPTTYVAYLLCSVKSINNITNKPFHDLITLNCKLKIDSIKKLNNLGILNFRYSVYNKSVVVSNGITTYTIDDNYKYLTTICMVQNILPEIKSILESNLGENIVILENKRTIDTKISELLTNKAKMNIVDKYDFDLKYDIPNGAITYEIELKNMYMAESISYIGNIKSN